MASNEEMEKIMMEAAKIDAMTATEGWQIIREYCERTIKASYDTWLYTDEKADAKKLKDAAKTCHAMINLVENFKEEGKRLFNLWMRNKGILPKVALDMDNESPNVEEE